MILSIYHFDHAYNQTMLEPLENRRLLAGVTILTHGQDGNITGWMATAANAIEQRIGASDTSEYIMKVDQVSKNTLGVTSYKLVSGPGIDNSINAEAIVLLDWTSVDGGSYSTKQVGDVVAKYLMVAHGSDRALANFPLDLIGHSRGASVMSDIAQRLGEAGVWVDQATYLDPHPVNGGIGNGFLDFGDPQVRAWDNITFVDNYWRDDGNPLNLDPDGEHITGAHEGDLNDSVQENFVGSAHNSVPAYYNGTIDLKAKNGGDEPIESSWYGGSNPARDATGFAFTRLGGTPRPADGLRTEFGGTAVRAATTQTGSQWGDVDDLQVLNGTTYTIGDTIPLRIKRQDRDDSYTITMWLDQDRNPYNDNNVRKISSLNFSETDTFTTSRINGSSSGIAPGKYYVYARITDAGDHARYTYSRRITLVAASSSTPAAAPTVKHLFSNQSTNPLLDVV